MNLESNPSLAAEIDQLRAENEMLKNNIQELKVTNDYLVSATWREREMKDELRKIKETLELRNLKINESISYAKNIQQSMISNETALEKTFDSSLIFYKPKDVVSGDFPWSCTHDNAVYLAAIDCTGHGVPGAMLAIVGNILLDNICFYNTHSTDEVLNSLHKKVVKVLRQNSLNTNINDGLDIALCRYLKEENKLQFSGAHRPLILIKENGEYIEIKGDRQAIGGVQGRKERSPFTVHTIEVEKGDKVFLFSDGFQDQFGGEDNKKYGIKRLRNFLKEHHQLPLQKMSQLMEKEWNSWKGDTAQTDDVLLMGVQV